MKMKFYELPEEQLNHLALKALETQMYLDDSFPSPRWVLSDWELCGIMIELLNIQLSSSTSNQFVASVPDGNSTGCYGETQRLAIVRCFVAHIFGEDYERHL